MCLKACLEWERVYVHICMCVCTCWPNRQVCVCMSEDCVSLDTEGEMCSHRSLPCPELGAVLSYTGLSAVLS